MTEHGPGPHPHAQQAGNPEGWAAPQPGVGPAPAGAVDSGWAPPQQGQPGAPEGKKGLKKWLPVGGSLVGAGVVAVGALGIFGAGDPEVGNCVRMQGETSFDVVDCGTDEAEYKIVGIEDDEMTWPDFESAVAVDEVCQEFATWEVALWIGDLETEPGTIYCSEPA